MNTNSHIDPPRYNDDSEVDMSRVAEIPVARSSWRLDFVWRRPSICAFSVWDLLPVTLLAPRISRWPLIFGNFILPAISVQVSSVVLVQIMTVFWVLYSVLRFVPSNCRNETLYTWLYVDSCTFGWRSWLCAIESVMKTPNVSSASALYGGERTASRLG